MTYVFYGILTAFSVIAVISALLQLIIGLFSKEKKKSLITCIIWILIGLLLLYLVYFAGEYSKWNLDKETKERLLSLSLSDSVQQEFLLDGSEFDCGTDVEIEVSNESIDGYEDMLYYDFYAKIYERKLYDADSFVLVMPRESDRGFDKIPPIAEYENTVVIINDGHSLKISFSEKENSAETLNAVLDELAILGIIS